MTDTESLEKRQTQTLTLVSINFVLFLVLFAGLGYVTWQSNALIKRLQGELDAAEQTIDQLQERFAGMTMESIADRVVERATVSLGDSIRDTLANSDIAAPLANATEKIAGAQETLESTAEAIQGINTALAQLDNDEIAQRVSYHILKGLGEGFEQAAESRKPAGAAE